MKSPHEMYADKMGGDSGDDESPDADAAAGSDDGYKAAVRAFIDAVHSKDADAAGEALMHAIALCPDDDGDEGDSAPSGHAAMLLIPHGKG